MNTFESIIEHVINLEGGYVDNEYDSGGKTNFGITEQVARDNGYDGDMKDMRKLDAIDIYRKTYWDGINGDKLLSVCPSVCEEVFDSSVNMGKKRAVEFLQRALNALNNKGDSYQDIKVDGKLGDKTLGALQQYLEFRSAQTLLKALNCLQGAFYIELAERREKDETFIYGWLKNRV